MISYQSKLAATVKGNLLCQLRWTTKFYVLLVVDKRMSQSLIHHT